MRFHERLGLRRYEQTGGRPDHLQIFASEAAAEAWFRNHDPEGVAFEYPVKNDGPKRPLF